ncbi:glycerol acyltransferase [Gordonia amarae]|uniref:Glycerol acyltransferase n=2 Tax=Gordonia amarae TaxID=36821 RepID=A0A857LKV4_9ACTN|nr:lysophospholipid acyltransferase family protein [Gordonia amarae]MCS3877970.1 1-acyl-sn-glycerol-3-phosphate acyltransferase [Gordonia amarae]QHN16675.1 glycerol acyltransferase [Gordonia amarae]QHN21200.1 glycerol acyltransferase [Gordonia amarae]QHN30054.1 glycerol acyltransferase [Gordonia amarae]QHN38827.1 glycerol acyltransferase [Gordonia amarae]
MTEEAADKVDKPAKAEKARTDEPRTDLVARDEDWVKRVLPLLRLIAKTYFRSEVTGMDKVPDGGALLVSNHSGGMMAFDVPVIGVAFADQFGEDRPLYTLAHDLVFTGPGKDIFGKVGFLPAHPKNAVRALKEGAATLVFPGGTWDAMRPTSQMANIDFGGRTGYVKTAIKAGVPIVPIVTIGGQETQWFINRGDTLAKLLRLDKLIRADSAPFILGFPFGLSLGASLNIPLPSKLVTRVLDPVHITDEFGADPDIDVVDAEIRKRMQQALDELAADRRFPILG